MKIFFGTLVVLILAGSILADYKWRQWMAARRHQRHGPDADDPARRHDRQ